MALLFADIALAQRMEKMDALAEIQFCRAHAILFPDVGATWESIGGGIAAFAGGYSPLTQAFGLGLTEPVSEREIESLERFFSNSRGPG